MTAISFTVRTKAHNITTMWNPPPFGAILVRKSDDLRTKIAPSNWEPLGNAKTKKPRRFICGASLGGSERRRSVDLAIFSRSLYQLSYRARE